MKFSQSLRNAWKSLHGLVFILALLGSCPLLIAQTPTPAAKAGFTTGWTLGTRFEGSDSGDGGVYDIGSALGYNFSPSSTKKNNPGAVSGVGIGAFFADLRWNYPGDLVNYSPVVHLTAPTGDTKKGFSTGHATWNLVNHIDHAFGDFSPFLDAGVGNTVMDTRSFHRPFITFGYNAQFNGGLEYDPGKFSFSVSAYDVAPWGDQTVFSRVFRCGSGTTCSAGSKSNDRKGYTTNSVTSGSADLVRDNGYGAGIDYKPVGYLDLEFDYSRSVPLHLNSYSFGIGVDLSWVLHPHIYQ